MNVAVTKRKNLEKNTPGKIDYRFKILYALGIIFVVCGHGAGGGIDTALQIGGWFPFYSFHLALFMFCSGYFYNINAHERTTHFIWKKIKRLIIPLFIWNLFYALFCLLISNFGFRFGVPITIEKLTTSLVTNGHQFAFNLAGWFVVPLFMIQVFTTLIRKILAGYNGRMKEWVLAIAYCCAGILGIWLSRKGWTSGWELVVTRMLSLMPYYGIGILYKARLEKYDNLKNWIYFLIIFAIQLAIIIKYGGSVPSGTPSWSSYKCIFGTIAIGLTGIAFWLRIARIVEPILKRSKIINAIADNTFPIMIHHLFGFWIVNLLFGTWTLIVGRGDFDWGKFKTSIWYKYSPGGCNYYRIIFLIAGIFIPICIAKIEKSLIHLISSRARNSTAKDV